MSQAQAILNIKEYKASIHEILARDADCDVIGKKFTNLMTSDEAETLFQIQLAKQWISRNYCCEPVMKTIGCVIKTILKLFQTSQMNPKESKMGKNIFRLWFPAFEKIGIPSVAGTVLRTSISGAVSKKKKKELFEQNHYHIEEANGVVVKFPNIDYEEDSWREYMIGLEINKLRKHIPNFMYMFGLYECNEIKENENPTTTMCTREQNKVPFSMMQFIKGEPWMDVLEKNKLPFEDIIIVLLQIVLALTLAKSMFNFQHNDLHAGNIMIVHEFPPRIITYPVPFHGKKSITITTSWIPVIIDFGMASINIPESKKYFPPPLAKGRDDVWLLIGNLIELTKGNLQADIERWFPKKYQVPIPSNMIVERILELLPRKFGPYSVDKFTLTISTLPVIAKACSCKDTPDTILEHLFEQPQMIVPKFAPYQPPKKLTTIFEEGEKKSFVDKSLFVPLPPPEPSILGKVVSKITTIPSFIKNWYMNPTKQIEKEIVVD